MIDYVEKIREAARGLLSEGKVDVFIGFRKGTVPMMSEPVLISDASKVDELWWDSNCGINLANYITKRKDRVGIVAKGCDSRNIVTHIVENQIKKEQLYIVGVPCQGMIDRRRVGASVEGEILEVTEDGEQITVKSSQGEQKLDRNEFLQANCAICIHRNPVIYDEMVAEPVEEQKDVDRYEDVRKIESMDPASQARVFLQADRTLYPLLRLPERLSAMLLSHLLRGRIHAPVGGQEPGPHGHHDLPLPEGLSPGGTMHGLRRV